MRSFAYLLSFLLMLNCAGASALYPQPRRVALSDRGYASYRSAGSYDGIAADLLNAVAGRVGCKIEFV